jgi:hypothetical protein
LINVQVIGYIFSRSSKLYQEKSGIPVWHAAAAIIAFVYPSFSKFAVSTSMQGTFQTVNRIDLLNVTPGRRKQIDRGKVLLRNFNSFLKRKIRYGGGGGGGGGGSREHACTYTCFIKCAVKDTKLFRKKF